MVSCYRHGDIDQNFKKRREWRLCRYSEGWLGSLLWIRGAARDTISAECKDKSRDPVYKKEADDCTDGVTAQSASVEPGMQVMRRWRLPQNTPQENDRSVLSALFQLLN